MRPPTARKISVSPQVSWTASVVHQALHRKTNTICFDRGGGASGLGTETHLWELAIGAVRPPIDGFDLWVPRHRRGQMDACQTPLEAEWQYEVATATMRAGLDRGTAGELVRKIGEKLKGRDPEEGVEIRGCYDLVNHRPSPEYQRI